MRRILLAPPSPFRFPTKRCIRKATTWAKHSLLQPDEVEEALWLIDVFERWDMPAEEADEWRRRILVHQR